MRVWCAGSEGGLIAATAWAPDANSPKGCLGTFGIWRALRP